VAINGRSNKIFRNTYKKEESLLLEFWEEAAEEWEWEWESSLEGPVGMLPASSAQEEPVEETNSERFIVLFLFFFFLFCATTKAASAGVGSSDIFLGGGCVLQE